jgi:hypothetical protein
MNLANRIVVVLSELGKQGAAATIVENFSSLLKSSFMLARVEILVLNEIRAKEKQ